MIRYLFGSNDNTTALVNEPTIDYNNTVYSQRSRLSGRESSPDLPTRWMPPRRENSNSASKGSHRGVIDYSDDELDSDQELTRDYNLLVDNFTRPTRKLDNDYSLPSGYPGKFSKKEPIIPTKPNYSGNLYNEKIDLEMEKLQQEINREINTKSHQPKKLQITSILMKIREQNEFLEQLNQLVDINQTEQQVPTNLLQKYNDLKQDYIKELKGSQALYQGYYKLILKYRSLRKDRATPNTNKSAFTIKEKIRLIKSKTTQEQIKLICTNLLREIEELDNKDATIARLQGELDAANLKIKQLEEHSKDTK